MDCLAALVELDIKVVVFDLMLFLFLNRHRNREENLYWGRNGFCFGSSAWSPSRSKGVD
ncbi:IS66 family insertion sequence element accessory protein TnpB [Pseudomonas sp. 3296]|uniref:IS66 family insertion sequence element accessory protein TnpB n=1 Tax=Pseudomonas sp. 3296 TaxID=2817753 RepID=UPI00286B9FD9|nr:IS66 family insertion sequence element accessory protein TnpB [Pseudomonas sp. 3296]